MLQDPENPFEEWESEVWAETLEAARTQCEYIAENSGLTEVLNVTQKTQKPSRSGSYLFICWFRSEARENGGSDN